MGEKHCLYVNHESGSDGIILTLPVIFPSEKSVLNLCGAERDKNQHFKSLSETKPDSNERWCEKTKNCLISQHVNSLSIEKMDLSPALLSAAQCDAQWRTSAFRTSSRCPCGKWGWTRFPGLSPPERCRKYHRTATGHAREMISHNIY